MKATQVSPWPRLGGRTKGYLRSISDCLGSINEGVLPLKIVSWGRDRVYFGVITHAVHRSVKMDENNPRERPVVEFELAQGYVQAKLVRECYCGI